ncbi:MAG TPA: ABC transporter permease [Actinomycetota bacterium]|nr:ABC transporter permease [Actinomycetota bacterium]
MTVLAADQIQVDEPRHFITGPIKDALAIAWRNLRALPRVPQYLVFSTIQPVIFVLMFRYVFGSALRVPGNIPYVDFLMPGIFVQTVVFGSMGTAIGLATDMQSGLMERFRSLPMARSALLVGRTLADLARNVFVVILMVAVGFAVGFRIHGGLINFLAACALVLLFGYALSWVFASIGLLVGDPESAQAAAFPILAPLVFASSVFVAPTLMPGWLRGFATHQPVSVAASAVRGLALGPRLARVLTTTSTGSFVLQSVAWGVGIVLVFGPIAVRRYRKAI